MDSHLETICKTYLGKIICQFLLTYGYGSAKSVVYDILGYEALKIISISLQTKDMSNYIVEQLHDKIDFSKPEQEALYDKYQ